MHKTENNLSTENYGYKHPAKMLLVQCSLPQTPSRTKQKLDSIHWFFHWHSGYSIYLFNDSLCHAHPWVCLHFAKWLCKMPHFGGWDPGGVWPWNSNSSKILVQCTYRTVQVSLPMFNDSEVIILTNTNTNKRTHKQTDAAMPVDKTKQYIETCMQTMIVPSAVSSVHNEIHTSWL